jgi:hypothetical protein
MKYNLFFIVILALLTTISCKNNQSTEPEAQQDELFNYSTTSEVQFGVQLPSAMDYTSHPYRIDLYSGRPGKGGQRIHSGISDESGKYTIEDIRNCRESIANEKDDLLLQKVFHSKDFYSTSSIRDLMFHVQEHRFTIPEISKMLKNPLNESMITNDLFFEIFSITDFKSSRKLPFSG